MLEIVVTSANPFSLPSSLYLDRIADPANPAAPISPSVTSTVVSAPIYGTSGLNAYLTGSFQVVSGTPSGTIAGYSVGLASEVSKFFSLSGISTSLSDFLAYAHQGKTSDLLAQWMSSGMQFIGGTGNDFVTQGPANDTINGGSGIDTVRYEGNRSGYTLAAAGKGWSVSSSTSATDTLNNVERIQFSDKSVAFDINANAGQVYRLYQAAFNRTPDAGGLGDWIYGMDNGMSLLQVSTGFIASAEFKNVYGKSATDSEVVIRFYQNVLHWNPEQAGYDYWMNQLQSGLQTREQVLIGFSESPENQTRVIGVIENGIEYTQHVV